MVAGSQFGVNRIIKLTGISKATYYAAGNPVIKFEQKYFNIKRLVEAVIEGDSSYGVSRIKAELLDKYQLTVGRDTLAKLLKLWGLDLKRKIKARKPNMIQKILLALADRTNLLLRSTITKPLQALSSDITRLDFAGGKAYLVCPQGCLWANSVWLEYGAYYAHRSSIKIFGDGQNQD